MNLGKSKMLSCGKTFNIFRQHYSFVLKLFR